MQTIEKTILTNLIHNESYLQKVLPFIKREYFSLLSEKIIFDHIVRFVNKYNTTPTKEAIEIAIQNDEAVTEELFKEVEDSISSLSVEPKNEKWLLDTTEKFCKDKAVYNAILNSISIIDGKDKNSTQDSIPGILQSALGVCFDTKVGHDYFDDAEKRLQFYHRKEDRIPFDLDYFNRITDGGLPNKTLNVVLAGTGIGKSLFLCHVASSCLNQGKNVLYITLEMSEEKIAERIDANLFDVPIFQLRELSDSMFKNRVKKIQEKTTGKLIIKEYPTASAHANHFRSLLNELNLKKSFKPDIIFVDYLNICTSFRFKAGSGANSYTIIKSIAEELRGLAVEFNVPILTATQTTRSGFNSSDVELTDTSESFGLPATADLMFALMPHDDDDKIQVKQLKNRYNDPNNNKRFVIGIDRTKMRLFDVEKDVQKHIIDSGQPFTKVTDRKSVLDFNNFKL